MPGSHLHQSHRRPAAVQPRHEAPVLVLGLQLLAARLEVGVQRGHLAPEVIQRTFEEVVGHEEVPLHITLFDAVTRLACQDDELADDVLAAEVDAWVGLGVALLLRHAYGLAERHVGAELVEDIVQRAAQHGLNLQNLVAAVDKVINGVDDGQARTHVGLEQVLHAPLTRRLLQAKVILVLAGRGNLIGRHDGDVVPQQLLVDARHVGAGRAVDEDAVEYVHADDAVAQPLRVALLPLLLQLLAEAGQVEALAAEH